MVCDSSVQFRRISLNKAVPTTTLKGFDLLITDKSPVGLALTRGAPFATHDDGMADERGRVKYGIDHVVVVSVLCVSFASVRPLNLTTPDANVVSLAQKESHPHGWLRLPCLSG